MSDRRPQASGEAVDQGPDTRSDAAPATQPPVTGGSRRRLFAVLAALLVVVLAAAVLFVVRSNGEPAGRAGPAEQPPAAHSPTLTRSDWTGTAVGVFRETQVANIREYEEFLGRPVDLVVDYSSREDWQDISRPGYLLEEWSGTDHRLVLGVAMLPSEEEASMEDGAAGEYDRYFRTLAEELVAADQQDAILRVGWEFNLDSWEWSTGDEDDWIAFYRNIVDAMRTVDGQDFRFDWNVNNGAGMRYDAVEYYPGDEYVDFVGVDAYDVSGVDGTYPIPDDCTRSCAQERRERAWDVQVYGGDRGLRFWSSFAAEHDKQLSIPEWGVWKREDGTGGGDNPYYIEKMADFIADPDNRVGYQAYFENANSLGTHRLMGRQFPQSRERYLELFGG